MLGILKAAKVTKLIPALAVAGVLGFSFLASVGANTGIFSLVGYGPCNSANVSASPANLQQEGSSVTLTATSTGCPFPEYKFYLQAPGGAWTGVSGYGGASFVWNTTGDKDGVWGIGVWVRNIGHSASYEAYYIGSYRIVADCLAAGLTATPGSPQPRGTSITLHGSAVLCSNPRFRFWVLTRHGTHWSSFGPYSNVNTATWNTTNYPKGANRIGVWVRQFNSGHSYDSYAIITFYLS